jgi:proline dehydrogenase
MAEPTIATSRTQALDENLQATMTDVLRALLLGASRNAALNRFMVAQGLRLGARRFVAGQTIDEFVPIVRALNGSGFSVASAILGEDVTEESQTREVVASYKTLLTRLADEHARATVALKLTHLGLSIGEPLAATNAAEIVRHAASVDRFVRFDMEESRYVDATLRIYRNLRESGLHNLGVVLQAYLYRAPDDLADLVPLHPNIRLVKGAYLEPSSVAYPQKSDVDTAFHKLIAQALRSDGFTAIATHDERAIRHAMEIAKNISRDRFEFQMLYGVRPALQRQILAEGFPVRIAAPFGREWYPYFMRRLAERPANVAFILRSLVEG